MIPVRIVAAALMLLAALPAQQEEELRRLARTAPDAASYPGADALVLKSEQRVQIEASGVVRTRMHRIVKIFNQRGRERFGEIRIPFSSADGVVKLIRGRTLFPDGSQLSLPEGTFDVVPLSGKAALIDYGDQLEAVIKLPGIEPGSVSEALVTLNRRGVDPGRVCGWVDFRGEDPVAEQTLTVRVPVGVDLSYAYSSDLGKPSIRRTGASTVYTWRAVNLPTRPREESGPDRGVGGSWVVYSTYPAWDSVRRHLAGNLFDDLTLTRTAGEAAASLVEGDADAALIAARLDSFLRRNFDCVALPPDVSDYRVRSASRIYDSGYGHDFDLAALSLALLKQAGVEAEPALVAASSNFIKSVPAPVQFDRIAVVIGKGDDRIWLYPGEDIAKSRGLAPEGRTVLRLRRDGYRLERIPEQPASKNSAQVRIEAELLPDRSLKGSTYCAASGRFSPYFLLPEGEKSLPEFARGGMRWAGNEQEIERSLILHRAPDVCRFELGWLMRDAVNYSGGLQIIRFPASTIVGAQDSVPIWAAARRTPLVVPTAWEEQEQIDLALPDGIVPYILPRDVKMVNEVGRLEIRSRYQEEGRLTIERFLRVEKRVVPPSDYPKLRVLLAAWRSPATTTVVVGSAAGGLE